MRNFLMVFSFIMFITSPAFAKKPSDTPSKPTATSTFSIESVSVTGAAGVANHGVVASGAFITSGGSAKIVNSSTNPSVKTSSATNGIAYSTSSQAVAGYFGGTSVQAGISTQKGKW